MAGWNARSTQPILQNWESHQLSNPNTDISVTLQVLRSKGDFPIRPGMSARVSMFIPSACHQLPHHKTVWQKASEKKTLLLANAAWKTLRNFLLRNSYFPFLIFISATSPYSQAPCLYMSCLFTSYWTFSLLTHFSWCTGNSAEH